MKIPAMILAELRRLTSRGMARLALAALMIVPILYGGLYLWANQDPYSRLDQVPVALVVSDEGAVVDGEETRYGDEVAANLVEDGSFDWRRMDGAEARTALERGEVDFAVTIPADFSTALASAGGESPHQATLLLATNDANNYLASTIGAQAIERIRTSVSEMVGEQAAGQLLDGLADAREGFATAADGAGRLADGADSAASGATDLAAGAAQLEAGAGELAAGTGTLAAGTAQVASGAAGVADGAARVADGAQQVAAGTATLDGYADQAGAAAQAAVDALPQLRSDLEADLAEQGFTPEQIDAILARLEPLATRLTEANSTVQSAVAQVDTLAAGAAQLSTGAAQLSGGAAQLSSGAAQVAAGAASAASGAGALHSGTVSLSDGAATLDGGLAELSSGAGDLHTGLTDAVTQIPASDPSLRTDQAQTIADPVAISSDNVASAGEYGAGLAPFFAALAGWIGIYALFLIVKPISRRAVTALHSPVRITIAGWLTPAVLGGIQMVALFGVLALALGFSFANPLATLGVMALASFVYAAIILALNVWLGSVGQFLGLVLMVLQLVTAGGTFPWQTLPAPLAALHQVLPMGYVVDAMRQLMYGGDLARIGGDVTVLLTWMLGALVVAVFGVTRMTHRHTLRDLAPSIMV